MWTRRESWGGAVTPTGDAPLNAYGTGLRPATGRRRRVGEEGPRPLFAISPGTVAIAWPDVSRAARTAERQAEAAHKAAQDLGRYLAEYAGDPAEPEPTRVISAWSAKSRARMTRTLAELDYRPLMRMNLRLPMTTLTYPGDWLAVAPTGRAVKRHMDQWRKRFERAWAFPFVGIWKLEFQRRGAPHIHLWGPEPTGRAGEIRRMTATRYRPAVGDGLTYRQWLSVVWADVVAHPDPEQKRRHLLAGTAVDFREGERMRDPRRLAIYFTKHGSYAAKEYQHEVPKEWQEPGKGPGRFWGYWGLETAAIAVEIDPAAAVWGARLLRRYARSQGTTRQVTVRRVDTRTGAIRYRKSRVRAERMRGGRGFLCVNDGPALGTQLARAVDRLDWVPVAPLPAPGDRSRPEPKYPTCDRCGTRLDPRLAAADGRHVGDCLKKDGPVPQ